MIRLLLALALFALPSLAAEPTWTHDLDVGGRAFVADHALMIAANAVKVAAKHSTKSKPEVNAWADSNLKDTSKEKFAVTKLKKDGEHYTAPNGMELGAEYVDFLVERVGAKALSFGFRGSCQPVIVLAMGKPIGLLMPRNVPGSAVEAPPEPEWKAVARLPDGTRYLLDSSFIFSEAQLAEMPMQNAGLKDLPAPDAEKVVAWMGTRVKKPFHLSDLRCGNAPGTYEGPGGLLLNARYIDYLRARMELWPLELHSNGPLEPIALVLKGRSTGVLMPMKP